jgi:hypothetical protein
MFFDAPSDVLLGAHSNRTKVLVVMGDYYILVIVIFFENLVRFDFPRQGTNCLIHAHSNLLSGESILLGG